ncbi:unnamed protein product [Pleuronectes platessa]|uniref:Uncharacterized protein n=1 Tax=Pleuronectes platessa TaxID=8262 RepID=A0A9N7TWE1_PLEPL|nr:unnamed protein product [Pleuronectes platessa]
MSPPRAPRTHGSQVNFSYNHTGRYSGIPPRTQRAPPACLWGSAAAQADTHAVDSGSPCGQEEEEPVHCAASETLRRMRHLRANAVISSGEFLSLTSIVLPPGRLAVLVIEQSRSYG